MFSLYYTPPLLVFIFLNLLPQFNSVQLLKLNASQHGSESSNFPFIISSGQIITSWPSYTINVDFTDTSADLEFNEVDKTHKAMAVSLYTNETFLGGECSNYLKFNCSQHNCFPRPHVKRVVPHPYFSVNGYTIHTEIYLDYSFFSNYYMDVVYAEKCSPNTNVAADIVYGTVGLGLSQHGVNNFMGDYPTFSIYLNDSMSSDHLLFFCDLTKTNPKGMSQILPASKNWELAFEEVNLGNLTIPLEGKVIFDLNSPFIGLPEPLYKTIISELKDLYNVTCYYSNRSTYGCIFKGNLTDLPIIQIGKGVMIPSQMYLQQRPSDGIYMYNLMIVSLSVEASVSPYVKVTSEYKDHVILGTPFMQHYYTCFESKPKGSQIIIYEKGTGNNSNAILMNNYLHIGVGMFISLGVCVIFCCISLGNDDKFSLEDKLDELRKPILNEKKDNAEANEKEEFFLVIDCKDESDEKNSVTPEFKTGFSSFATTSTDKSFEKSFGKCSEGNFSFSLSE